MLDELPTRLQNPGCQQQPCTSPQTNSFFLAGRLFRQTFMILTTTSNILIGKSVLKEKSVTLDCRNNLVHFQDLSLYFVPAHEKFKCGTFELKATKKLVLDPFQQVMVPMIAATEIERSSGIFGATPSFSRKSDLIVTPAPNQLHNGRATIQVTNPNAHTFTLSQGTLVANFRILTPGEASHVHPMSLQELTLVSSYPDEATNVINQLFQPPKAPTTDRKRYPTSETC